MFNPIYVLMTYDLRGDGTEKDVYRRVMQFWNKETLEFIGEIDPTKGEQS